MEYLRAFIVGGIICCIGQIFIDRTKLTPARILVGFVVAGVILSALGFYEPLVEFAGAGATVPLSGFGHTLAKGVRSAVAESPPVNAPRKPLSATAARTPLARLCPNPERGTVAPAPANSTRGS